MNIIPLLKKDESLIENKELSVYIPINWWNSSYSCNYGKEQKNIETVPLVSKNLPITPGWDVKKGDYRVKEASTKERDSVYYRDIKLKLSKYSIYPVILATILLEIIFLKFLSKM